MENNTSLPLHLCKVMKSSLIINRLHIFFHGIALIFLINYRASNLYTLITTKSKGPSLFIFPHILIFISELVLSFFWAINQAFRWRPVERTVFPERLPEDDKLPPIDVFICTADPSKEPSVEVMNTVISAMAIDYPPHKLHVYLSDDAGSSLTLFAIKEAWKFACLWLPFCQKYGVKNRCPEAYFSGNEGFTSNTEFILQEGDIKKQYEAFKNRVEKFRENTGAGTTKDHPSIIEVINDDKGELPLLVYIAREKRPAYSHHFKAGALNVLLRVSGMMSNSPYILFLDCDMYCNDPSSARQALCFFLDNQISPKLAFVEYPQKFHNLSQNDIYDGQLRYFFMRWNGFDGLKGPALSGTNVYMRREALYGVSNIKKDADLQKLQKYFGPSNEFIASIYKPNIQNRPKNLAELLKEAQHLASCDYERYSEWGEEVGFRYVSVVEDFFTGYMLCCHGWKSVFIDPPRPAFLGTATTNLSDLLVQHTRWQSGSVEVALSKYSPLLYGLTRMPILQTMCYAELSYFPFYCLPLWSLAILPQLCLVHGIPLYPPVSSPIAMVFGFIFLSSILKHMQEILFFGCSIRTWLNDQRMWMIKGVTCFTYGALNAILEKFGAREASFQPTNKVADEGQLKRYQMDIFDFQASAMFVAPICTLIILNAAALIVGGAKMIINKTCDEMFIQSFISVFILIVQYPVIEGIIIRKDKGRVDPFAAIHSFALALVVMLIGYFLLML